MKPLQQFLPIPVCFCLLLSITIPAESTTPAAPDDPFGEKAPDLTVKAPIIPVIRLEAFSLPIMDSRKALEAHTTETELYSWFDGEADKENGPVKLELFSIVRTRSGQRMNLEETMEFPYAVDFEPPHVVGLPQVGTNGSRQVVWPRTFAMPTNYETKNLGFSIELEFEEVDEHNRLGLRLAPALVSLNNLQPMTPSGDVLHAQFDTQKANCALLVKMGTPALVGTFTPAQLSDGQKDPPKRIWLLFLTPTLP